MNAKEVADSLDLQEATIRAWVFQRRLDNALVRLGRSVRFSPKLSRESGKNGRQERLCKSKPYDVT